MVIQQIKLWKLQENIKTLSKSGYIEGTPSLVANNILPECLSGLAIKASNIN